MTNYVGDYVEDAIVRINFNTAGVFAGTPVAVVYKDASITEITPGTSITIELDGQTDYHQVVIDLSASASYTPGSDYSVVLSAGTVNGVPVAGQIIGSFSIENRSHLIAGKSLTFVNDSTAETHEVTVSKTP